jgi:hypothetical protein
MNERFQYEFHGMDPSEWTESFVEGEFESLLALAPRNCHMKVKIDRFESGIQGKLVAYSDRGAFVVEDYSDDITSLTKSLKKKMKAKLQKWRDVHQSYQHGRAG